MFDSETRTEPAPLIRKTNTEPLRYTKNGVEIKLYRIIIGAALKCAPIMEWEFILASGRSSF